MLPIRIGPTKSDRKKKNPDAVIGASKTTLMVGDSDSDLCF